MENDTQHLLDMMAADMYGLKGKDLNDFLNGLLKTVVLAPTDLTCQIHYRIPAERGNSVASPRVRRTIPSFMRLISRKWLNIKIFSLISLDRNSMNQRGKPCH